MDFTGSQRPRVRGKPFKLFTDDLPKIDFNKSYLHDYNSGSVVEKRIQNARSKRQYGFSQDQFSLPSIESPDWDSLSTPEPQRPRSHVNVFNPNIAQLNKKIRRRHTVRETREHPVPDRISRRADDDISVKSNPSSDSFKKATKTEQTIKTEEIVTEAFVHTTSTRSFQTRNFKQDSPVHKDESTKTKSILQQLLEASAKDNARRKMVEEGFKLFRQENYIKRQTVKSSGGIQRRKIKQCSPSSDQPLTDTNSTAHELVDANPTAAEKNVDQSANDITENRNQHLDGSADNSFKKDRVKIKPGILKNNTGSRNIRKHQEHSMKPRLVHQDSLQTFTETCDEIDSVKLAVHINTPFRSLNTLVYSEELHKPRTKRRVNFDEISEENARLISAKAPENCNTGNKQPVDEELKIDNKLNNGKFEHSSSFQKYNIPSVRKRDSIRRKPKKGSAELKHTSSFYFSDSQRKEETNTSENISQVDLLTEKLKDPRSDPFWKEVKQPVAPDQNKNDTTNLSLTPIEFIPEVNNSRIPLSFPPGSRTFGKSTSRRKIQHIPTLHFPSDTASTPTTGSIFGSPDFDALSDVHSFFGDIEVDDFPEEIDRSLLGEDLIKAYRIWDRKRKAFPGGLRKIEAPSDQPDDMYAKALSTLRTYKLPSQPPPMKPSNTDSKESLSSVVIGSF